MEYKCEGNRSPMTSGQSVTISWKEPRAEKAAIKMVGGVAKTKWEKLWANHSNEGHGTKRKILAIDLNDS